VAAAVVASANQSRLLVKFGRLTVHSEAACASVNPGAYSRCTQQQRTSGLRLVMRLSSTSGADEPMQMSALREAHSAQLSAAASSAAGTTAGALVSAEAVGGRIKVRPEAALHARLPALRGAPSPPLRRARTRPRTHRAKETAVFARSAARGGS
jgi:hypothetical protein